jgi:hypothetical protein
MSTNYNLRRSANPPQGQPGQSTGEGNPEFQSQQTNPEFQSQMNPELQSQGSSQPGLQSQQTNQKSQQSSFQSSESTKQVRIQYLTLPYPSLQQVPGY